MDIKRIHPLVAVASVAVILFSGLGAAAIMGWLPSSTGQSGDDARIVSSEAAPAKSDKMPSSAVAPTAKPAQPAVAAAKPSQPATAKPVQTAQAKTPPVQIAKAICAHCGVVQAVLEVEQEGQGTGLGAVGGAVVGGVVGNQFGGGSGKKILTVAGAVGGGVAGHQIEKKVRATKSYEITVRFEDGTTKVFSEANPPSWRTGDKVKLIDGKLQPNNA